MLLAIGYLILAVGQNIGCWAAAFGSTLIYTLLYWDVTLYMESALNIYYMAMAVYGWWQWRSGFANSQRPVIRWSITQHSFALGLIMVSTLFSGYLLARHSDSPFPYLDSFTTWAAVVTTYMVAQKVLENWWYWIVINSVGIYLNYDRCLLLTVVLLLSYQCLSLAGWWRWRQECH